LLKNAEAFVLERRASYSVNVENRGMGSKARAYTGESVILCPIKNVCKIDPEWFVPEIGGVRFRAGYDQPIEMSVTENGDLTIRPFEVRVSPICPRNLWQ
jgi:hypothetical protein